MSTMTTSREMQLGIGSVVVANYQTNGRCRLQGRSWQSAAGMNLLFTLCLSPATAKLAGLPLRLGVATIQGIELYMKAIHCIVPSLQLKWPNDVLLVHRKVAGIICEASQTSTLVGIGVNCNQRVFSSNIQDKATSLSLHLNRTINRWHLLESILSCIHCIPDTDDAGSWVQLANQRLWKKNQLVCFRPGIGDEKIYATLQGLDAYGNVIMRKEDTLQPLIFSSGELS